MFQRLACRVSVFKHAFSSVEASGLEPVRIVYLMTLNGRDTRQAVRLLKMIYHTNNYYFIHIDSVRNYHLRIIYNANNYCLIHMA